jgi:Flp pilus assembly protein TadD
MAENLNDVDQALESFGTTVAFNRRAEAVKLAASLLENFGENIDVLMTLGAWHEGEGRGTEADRCFERALSLAPENKAALRAVGIGRLEQGKLDEAHRLLSFMLDPGAEQDLAVLGILAAGYQQADRHDEAMQIFACILKGQKSLGQDKDFRKAVADSEQNLALDASILPKKQVSYLLRVGLPLVAAAALGGVLCLNHVLSLKQDLYLVNGFGVPIEVCVDGGGKLKVPAHSRRKTTIAEGKHTAMVSYADGKGEPIDFVVENSILQRWWYNSIFVLNPRSAATLIWQEVIYTTYNSGEKPRSKVLWGKQFFALRDIDYAFETAPQRIETENTRIVRQQVEVIKGHPTDMLSYFTDRRPENIFNFIELHLELAPGDESLLNSYVLISGASKDLQNRRDVLMQVRLKQRPVLIEWHRSYQELNNGEKGFAALLVRYDKLLAADAENSALLYLRGRLSGDGTAAKDYYQRSVAADPKNPYPHMAMAYHSNSRGQFANARRELATAITLKGDDSWEANMYTTRFALGEYAALLKEMRGRQQRAPMDAGLSSTVTELLVKSGDVTAAEKELARYSARLRQKYPGAPAEAAILDCRISLQVFKNQSREILKIARRVKDKTEQRNWQLQAYMALGDMSAAEKLAPRKQGEFNWSFALRMYVGWHLAGNAAKAKWWLDQALVELKAGRPSQRRVAGLLEQKSPAAEAVLDVSQRPGDKVTTLLALACRHPAISKPLVDLAERLNYSLYIPHNFVQRSIAKLRKK